MRLDPLSIGDMNITNGSLNNLNPTINDGVYTVELTPTVQNGTLDMNFYLFGSGISTSTFGNSFSEISEIISHKVEPPEILSLPLLIGLSGNMVNSNLTLSTL